MKETEEVLVRGGFEIKQWICSNTVTQEIVDDFQRNNISIKILKTEHERVLGMVWKPEKDQFHSQINLKSPLTMKATIVKDCKENVGITPRQLVSVLAGIYDPMGLLLPYIIEGKLLMRKTVASSKMLTTEQKQKWDIKVEPKIHE